MVHPRPKSQRSPSIGEAPVDCLGYPMEKLLTAGQVAEILNVSTAWVYDHAERKRPQLPSVRLGKAVRFRPGDIENFIEEMSRFAPERKLNGACYDGPRISARH